MDTIKINQIELIINALFKDAKYDGLKMIKSVSKSILRPMKPSDFKDVYLSISKEQGEGLTQLIKNNKFQNIVEFGTSFGISTLFLAKGAAETNGHIITTELIVSKAQKAIDNFKKAGINDLIEVRVGNALETLRNHETPIDLLFLDGWKDLYLPLFQLLEPNFHSNTVIYVDNADMSSSQSFLKTVNQNGNYQIKSMFDGKVALIQVRK